MGRTGGPQDRQAGVTGWFSNNHGPAAPPPPDRSRGLSSPSACADMEVGFSHSGPVK